MQALAYDDVYQPRVSSDLDNQRRRALRASSWCGDHPISPPNSSINVGFPRKFLSYDKLPQRPLVLIVRKLDGSSFDVEVSKEATVAELKNAVEDVFSHMQRKISWTHVWGHFCLRYDDWKLTDDSEPLSIYGINDGDQLYFVHHASNIDELVKRRSKYRSYAFEQPKLSDRFVEREENVEKNESSDDDENSSRLQIDDDTMRRYESKLAQFFGGLFSYHRVGIPEKKSWGNPSSSRMKDGFFSSFRNMAQICSSDGLGPHGDRLEEV